MRVPFAQLPKELQAEFTRERKNCRVAAAAFARACETGDADTLYEAVDFIQQYTMDGWRLAMKRAGRLPSVSNEIRSAFLEVWIQLKMLPRRVGDRRLLANALRVLMPCTYRGDPMRVYRGTRAGEHRRRIYGFSWTTHMGVAREFADHWRRMEGGAVVLETVAPADAILLVREEENYYDEGEIVVDPFRLGQVKVVDRLMLGAPEPKPAA
jgi:hypothetical protein